MKTSADKVQSVKTIDAVTVKITADEFSYALRTGESSVSVGRNKYDRLKNNPWFNIKAPDGSLAKVYAWRIDERGGQAIVYFSIEDGLARVPTHEFDYAMRGNESQAIVARAAGLHEGQHVVLTDGSDRAAFVEITRVDPVRRKVQFIVPQIFSAGMS